MNDTPDAPAGPPADAVLHVADIHFWELVANPLLLLSKRFAGNFNVWRRRRFEFQREAAEPYAAVLARTGVRDIVLTGDFTSTATRPEYRMARRFIDQLLEHGLRVHLMPGNHDVYTFYAEWSRRFERWFKDLVPGEGYPALRRLPGGTPLLLVPTVCASLLTSRGRIRAREVRRVAELLDGCGGGPVLAAGHYPFLHRAPGYVSAWPRQLAGAEALREVLGRGGRPLLYMAGHVHRFSHVRDTDYPGLEQLTTGAFIHKSLRLGKEGEFSEVRVRDGGFEVARHTCAGGAWSRSASEPG